MHFTYFDDFLILLNVELTFNNSQFSVKFIHYEKQKKSIKINFGLVETPILHLKLHIGAKNFPGFFKSNITLLKSVFFVYT